MLVAFLIGVIGLTIHIYFKYSDSVKKRKNTEEVVNKRRKKRKTTFVISFIDYLKLNKERIIGSFFSYVILFIIMYFKIYMQFDFLTWLKTLDTDTYTVYFVIGYFADSIIRNILIIINNIKITVPEVEEQ